MFIVHSEASRGWGGQEIRVLTEAQGLAGRGHRVELICPQDSRIFAAAASRGVAATALPIGRKNLAGWQAMRAWLRAARPDVINTHSSTDTWLAALAGLGWPGAPRLVRTRHISAAPPNNFATRWLYHRASSHVVTTGEALRRQLIDGVNLAPERVTSVPTGIDIERYAPGDRAAARRALGLAPAALIVGIVATLRSWKGHDDLLDAFARFPASDTHLAIVGDGPRRAHIEQRIADLDLVGRVHLPGNQEDVVPWLQAMDLFVLPSFANEGVPQALMQAMACALPCITTHIGAIAEIAANEHTALIVPPRDVAALAQALGRLLGDAELRRRLGAAALAQAVERFGTKHMLDRMEAIFLAAAGGARP
jgi:glycosyltransferase involved in cell wall biosynthesis